MRRGAAEGEREGGEGVQYACSPGARSNPRGSLSGVETHCWFSPLMFALSCSIVTRCALSPPTPLRPMGATHKARASHISRLIVSICRSSPLDDSSYWGESGHRTTDRFSKRTPRVYIVIKCRSETVQSSICEIFGEIFSSLTVDIIH